MAAPRWLLLTTLVLAPWAYGGTRLWAIRWLVAALFSTLALWGVSCLSRRTLPRLHPVLVAGGLALALQGAWMVFHGQSSPLAWARAGGILGVIWFVSDLARQPVWRKRLWWTIGLNGAALALFGLGQRLARAPGIFWEPDPEDVTFFATFSYHANAGAFLNLVWPLAAGAAVAAFRNSRARARQFVWLIALVTCLAGIFVNTSRASSFLAVVLLVVLLAWLGLQVFQGRLPGFNPASVVVASVLMLATVGGVAATVGIDRTLFRWREFGKELSADNARLQAARLCWKILPDAGWFGFGPGTFPDVFAKYQHQPGSDVTGRWLFAHEDYLQTLIEWGVLGGTSWALVLLGGGVIGIWARVRRGRGWAERDRILWFVTVSALGGVALHGLVDYPWQIASIQLYVATLTGLLWSSRHWTVSAKADQPADV